MKLILFNGPPRSGKDTACEFLKKNYNIPYFSMIKYLKNYTHKKYGLIDIEHDHFEAVKDAHVGYFNGMSPREAYIKTSIEDIYPRLGETYYAACAFHQDILNIKNSNIVSCSDFGKDIELEYFINKLGKNNICLITLERDGFAFTGDNRNYININDHRFSDIFSRHIKNETLDLYEKNVNDTIKDFIMETTLCNSTRIKQNIL